MRPRSRSSTPDGSTGVRGADALEEIASAVLGLCSLGAGFVHGVALPVDGGYTTQ